MEGKTQTYLHGCKCMNCGLHFIACSWTEEWPDAKLAGGPVCPECGSDALMRWAPIEDERFIFQIVPGEAHLISADLPTTLTNDPATS